MKDIINRELNVGDTVVFSRPSGSNSSELNIGTISKYNRKSGFISVTLLMPDKYSWSNKVVSLKFSPRKFYKVVNLL